jgi:hypothetical protein
LQKQRSAGGSPRDGQGQPPYGERKKNMERSAPNFQRYDIRGGRIIAVWGGLELAEQWFSFEVPKKSLIPMWLGRSRASRRKK